MTRIRYLAASLLCLTGSIHVGRLGMEDAPVVIVVSFGVAYLIIGGLLFGNYNRANYFGAIVPVIGLCVGPIILKNPPILLAALLGVLELAAVVSCLYLIKRSRSANKTPESN